MKRTKLAKILFIFSIAAVITSTIDAAAVGEPQRRSNSIKNTEKRVMDKEHSCACSREYWPVCGFDGFSYKTYPNDCMLRCKKVKKVKNMPCDQIEDKFIDTNETEAFPF